MRDHAPDTDPTAALKALKALNRAAHAAFRALDGDERQASLRPIMWATDEMVDAAAPVVVAPQCTACGGSGLQPAPSRTGLTVPCGCTPAEAS